MLFESYFSLNFLLKIVAVAQNKKITSIVCPIFYRIYCTMFSFVDVPKFVAINSKHLREIFINRIDGGG